MEINAVLFDLDGTLLPMNQNDFIRGYLGLLAKKLAPLGYESQKFLDSMRTGVRAVMLNDGSMRNEELFWKVFGGCYKHDVRKDEPVFEEFYNNEFHQAKAFCGENPGVKEMIEDLRKRGKKVVLATSPFFPAIATRNRMGWVGLAPEDFDYVTTYENCSFTKPNKNYYEGVLEVIGCKAEECLMIGNDVSDDMVTEEMGMQVFLLTDCLINKHEKDISRYPQGNMEELKAYLHTI